MKRSRDYNEYMKSPEWRERRQEAFKFYGRRCSVCGLTSNLHVHHKSYERFKNELMLDLEILCEDCHLAKHGTYVTCKKRNTKEKKTPNYKKMAMRGAITRRLNSEIFEEAVGVYKTSGVAGLDLRFSKTKRKRLFKSKKFKRAIKII